MHIITQKRVWEAKIKYPQSAQALDGWYRIMKRNNFMSFSDMKKSFNSVDKVGHFYVFDIGGNKLRLLANIYFCRAKVYVRFVLNHKEYSKGRWV